MAEAVDVDALVATASDLVRIPSWDGQESAAQRFMADAMRSVGLRTDVWTLDLEAVARHEHHATEIERSEALGVVGTLGAEGGGRSLILNGHVDVVPPGDVSLWTRPPFSGEVALGRLHGRGALDMKGGLVAGLFALDALHRSGVTLAGPVHLMSVVGEEDGGLGTLGALIRGWRADGAIVMEPTAGAVAPAQAGCLNFRIRITGRAAHGAVRDEGVSALDRMEPVLASLRALEERRTLRLAGDPLFARYPHPFALCVGTVRGGDWASSVPDHVTLEGRLGLAPGEAPSDARREMAAALEAGARGDAWLAAHPPRLEWWGGRFLGARTDPDHALVRAVHSSAEAVEARSLPLEGMPYGADMGLLSVVGGMPTVLYGAGDIRDAHRPDESVAVDDLAALARSLAVAAMRFCGVAGSAG